MTLDAAGLDAAYGGRLSSVTIIDTRDGIRDRRLALSGSLGVATGDVLLEGALPNTESGSWWATARGTYYRPFAGLLRTGVLPSFGDIQFKISARPSRRPSLSVFGLVGRETMHAGDRDEDGNDVTTAQFRGVNRLAFSNLSWTPSARLVTTTTLSMSANDTRDFDSFTAAGLGPTGLDAFTREISVRDLAVRQAVAYAVSSGHVLDAGVAVQRIRTSWWLAGVKPPIFWRGTGPSTWGEGIVYPSSGFLESELARTQTGAWMQARLRLGLRAALEPGVRVDWNSFTSEAIWQPRVRMTARLGRTAVWAGFAAQAQTPSHESLQGFDYFHLSPADGARLRNERSTQIALGLERALGAGVGVRAEMYRRRFDRLLVQRRETDDER